ncbi:phosphotransferase family protein [Streptomyces sp. NPDC056728]
MIETPSPSALAQAARAIAPGARARCVSRLAGGTHAMTHLLHVGPPEQELVLRRFPPGDPAPGYEAGVLAALEGLDGWAPRLVDADPDGSRYGAPAVLITRIPGNADITNVPPAEAATQLGRVLALIHATPTARLSGLRDGTGAALAASARTGDRGPAATVVAAHGYRLAEQQRVLTHYDFWSGNVLWQQQTLTGVVDWSGASLAPRGFDVSWCRLDLALLHGPDTAEAFLSAYEEAAGVAVADTALWDLFALSNSYRTVETWLPNYHDLGRGDLSAIDLRERHTRWTEVHL